MLNKKRFCWVRVVSAHLANCRCRRTASPRWGRSSRGRGSRSCFCSKGCHTPRLSSTCHIHSTLDWRLSYQACTFRVPSSYWDRSWSWKGRKRTTVTTWKVSRQFKQLIKQVMFGFTACRVWTLTSKIFQILLSYRQHHWKSGVVRSLTLSQPQEPSHFLVSLARWDHCREIQKTQQQRSLFTGYSGKQINLWHVQINSEEREREQQIKRCSFKKTPAAFLATSVQCANTSR